MDLLPKVEAPARPAPATVQAPPPPEQAAVQAQLQQKIVPRYFDVNGSTAVPFDQIVAILKPLAGHEITVANLVKEVDRITVMYQQRGYPLSFALLQNQDFAKGVVKVTIVEGHISRVHIDGDIGNAKERLQALAAPLTAEKPLTRATLERVLNLMRAVPGVHITPKLDLPRRADGATELFITATRRKFGVTGSAADLGAGLQGIVNVTANSLTPLGEQTKLTAAVPTRSNDVTYLAGSIKVPIGHDGMALELEGYHYQARPQDDNLQYLGWNRKVTNQRLGAALSYPLLLNNAHELKGSIGLYASRTRDDYSRDADNARLEQDANLRVAHADLKYTEVGTTQSREISLGVYKGLSSMGASQHLTTNYGVTGSPGYDLDFIRYNAAIKQTFKLPAGLGLTISTAGQYSKDVLPSTEEVAFGGWRYALGYPQGEAGGDKGYGLSLELNKRIPIGGKYVTAIQPYVSTDYARTWYNAEALSGYNGRRLSSVALGVRLTDDRYYLFDVNAAKPTGSAPINDPGRSWRVNANMSFFYNQF